MIIRAKLTPEPGSRNKRRHRRAVAARLASYKKNRSVLPKQDGVSVVDLEKFFGPIVPKRFT
jgi:hypothetical protein